MIIAHAELHEGIAPLESIGPVMVLKARLAKVPVVVHLDHGEHLDYLKKAIDIGFTSVMFDGSLLPVEENVSLTKEAVAFAHERGVSVEAEIGALPSREDGQENHLDQASLYTDPALAKDFVEETGIDALAASLRNRPRHLQARPEIGLRTHREDRRARRGALGDARRQRGQPGRLPEGHRPRHRQNQLLFLHGSGRGERGEKVPRGNEPDVLS